ncbi:hypothetical protein MCC93_15470 [Morococcus cerebrosus]|uniref:Uncharacterized protein n=1 Tax=Morococcus cerebrosus TaxID=1056807 RepID=A0A0C1GKV5_9NEIS|nr:hypothetical protein MCC93_15470 [Morococcus cerebrosus]
MLISAIIICLSGKGRLHSVTEIFDFVSTPVQTTPDNGNAEKPLSLIIVRNRPNRPR